MDLEFLKNRKIQIGIIIIILIILFLISGSSQNTPSPTITQTIQYSDVYITKTISSGDQQTENYAIKLTNPVVGFLLLPDERENTFIKGDFNQSEITPNVFFLEATNYSPGTKNITLETKFPDTNKTSILLLIPLTDYTNFTIEEKAILKEQITTLAQNQEIYSIEKSLEIMQEYHNLTK